MGRVKLHGLIPGIHLKIGKFKLLFHPESSLESQLSGNLVSRMGINGPMDKNEIRFQGLQQVFHFNHLIPVKHRIAIDLSEINWLHL